MTADLPAPLTRVPSVLTDTPPDEGWVPDVPEAMAYTQARGAMRGSWGDGIGSNGVETPEQQIRRLRDGGPPPAPLPEVVADMVAAANLDHEAADWRTHAAWARTQRKTIAAAKRARGKRVAALRAQYGSAS